MRALLVPALLLALPGAAADHWGDDAPDADHVGDSTCNFLDGGFGPGGLGHVPFPAVLDDLPRAGLGPVDGLRDPAEDDARGQVNDARQAVEGQVQGTVQAAPATRGLGAPDAGCTLAYLCTGSAPPQAVDLALHCAMRAAGEAEDVALWIPWALWDWALDFPTSFVEDVPAAAHDRLQPTLDADVNPILCGMVWSHFCDNPVVIPEHLPANDPVGPQPPLP